MRRKLMVGIAGIFIVIASAVAWWLFRPTAQASTDLAAVITNSSPSKANLRLTNISDHACQVATTAQGTVAVTSLVQGGKTIQPQAVDSATGDDIGYLLKDQLKTLKPGESQDIPLPVYKLHAGYVLHAVTWSADAGAVGTDYAFSGSGPLAIELGYSLPIAVSGDPACGGVFASNTSAFPLMTWLMITSGAILALLVIAAGWWLWRHKHRHAKKIKTAAFIILTLGLAWCGARAALADVVVPPELQSDYDSCMGIFNANRDITQPILDMLNNPANHFEIAHTYGVGSDMTGRPTGAGGGSFTIYWNPNDHHRYAGTGGFPDKCTVLYHELFHALDMLRGTFSRDDCAGSGIETKEVEATRAENQLRVRLGEPPRSHYGDRPLPSGSCRGPAPRHISCTGDRCGDTNGDPHLLTFDGLRYDFQAAGEFVLARSKLGDFEIQVRQEPWLQSKLVAINTAAAAKMGTDKVEIRAGEKLTLLINGKTQSQATVQTAGGTVTLDDDVVTLTWKDGSVAYVRSVGVYGVGVSMSPSKDLTGKLEGLLGDADGNSKNDLHARGNTATVAPTYQGLYPGFADSWRISDGTSLFTYQNGKHTSSYTIHGFPEKPTDPKSLPGYAAAEMICKSYSITDPTVLANCTLDVAITGRPEFARAAANTQAFTVGSSANATTWQFTIKNVGDTASATFDAKAGQKIFVQVAQTNLPSQCGGLRLLGPDKSEIASGCIINGIGEIDGTILPTTGTYTVVLQADNATGSASVRLLRIADKQTSITPDGPDVTVDIDQPGVVGRYTFTGREGQYIYVSVPSSTLDSQCGMLQLRGPDGQMLSSGCIINHVGYIDTTRLPANGQYSVVVDPNDTATGQAQLRVVVPTAGSFPIALNGPAVTVPLKKPGSFATLTFDGTAGQRIFVDVPTSELPSQCGLLQLRAPDGSGIAAGCVINGIGNLSDDGVVLPSTGRYTIMLDPNAGDTGTSTVRLRSK